MEYIKKHSIFCLSVISLLFYVSCSGQNSKSFGSVTRGKDIDSTEYYIKLIRKEYARINSGGLQFRIVKNDLEGQSTEGGTIQKYYDGNNLRKAVLIYYGENGKATYEYYFLEGQLFFCFERVEEYKRPIYADSKSKAGKVSENRYYFHNLSLIRWIDANGKIVSKSMYSDKKKEIFEDVKKFAEPPQ